MNKDKKWMLMTYYCPTHGDAGRVEPIELTRQEISKNLFDKNKSKKEIKPIKIEAHNNLIVSNLFILAYFVFKII